MRVFSDVVKVAFISGLLAIPFSVDVKANSFDPAPGFADLHNHVFAEYAYGGGWFHGHVEGHIHDALSPCTGNADFLGLRKDHARTFIPLVNEFIGKIPGTQGDTGWHLAKRGGAPAFKGWPRWDTIAHQQNWEGYLKKAHEDGMTLSVISAVNFEPLCRFIPASNRIYSCNDMQAVDRQIDALHQFVEKNDWVELALDPTHARDIIRRGKLAVVLAIEVSDLFGDGDWKSQFNHYHERGVRSLQIVHQLNNRFGGTAPHHFVFKFFQILRDMRYKPWPWKWKLDLDSMGKNKIGLTDEGKELVYEMMNKRMLIDLSHLSEKGVKDISPLVLGNGNYPVFISHGHVREMMTGDMSQYEKTSPTWVLDLVKATGGMLGLRTGPEKTKSFGDVPNDCDGSSKSFAQVYQYADEVLGLQVGFGSDLNGFIQQLRPRFGGKKETCGAAPSIRERNQQQALQTEKLGEELDHTGFGHIGQIGSVLRELKKLGSNTSNLEKSTENFLKMWERAYERAPSPGQDDLLNPLERSLATR